MKKVGTVRSRTFVVFLVTLCALASLASVVLLANPAQAFAASTTAELKATKTLEGSALTDGQFTFKIEAKTDGAPMPEKTEATNDANGNISFGSATYTAAGTYEYNVTEVAGSDPTITYDTEAKTITATVTKTKQSTATNYPNAEAGKPEVEQQLVSLSVGDSTAGTNVTVDYAQGEAIGNYTTYKTVTGPEGSYHPFCGVYYASSDDSESEAWNKRNRYGFEADNGGGGLWSDSVLMFYKYSESAPDFIKSRISKAEDDHAPERSKYINGIKTIFLNGYPHNASGLQGSMSTKDFYYLTQAVLFSFSRYGGDYTTADSLPEDFGGKSVNAEVFTKLYNGIFDWSLVDPVIDNGDGTYGSKIDIYVHWLNEGSGGWAQPLLSSYLKGDITEVLSAEATTVEFKNTKTGGSSEDSTDPSIATSAAGTSGKTIKAEANQTITDTVTYKNLTVGTKYKVTGKLMNKTTGEEVAATCTPAEFTAEKADGTETVTFVVDASNFDEGTQLVVYETLYVVTDDGAETEVTSHENLNDTAQTVTVTSSDSTVEPLDLKTTISVGGKQADEGKVLKLDGECYAYVVDTVSHQGLTQDADYRMVGKLMKFTGEGANVEESEVAEAEVSFQGTGDDQGVCTIDFGNVKIDADSYYVVYEYAYDTNNTLVAKHENKNDLAQAVVVETVDKDWPIITENSVNVNEPNSFDDAVPLSMVTTVSINNQAASANQARTVSYADVSKVKNVKDTITYTGFDPSKTYTVKAQLVDTATGKVLKNGEVQQEQTVDGNGKWEMDFTGITLEAGHKYVVFEYAYETDADGNLVEVARHAEVNDKAQTIVVTAKPSLPSSATKASKTTAKTADTASGVALVALLVAVVAAASALGARRKSQR